jgi:hypothetical protein
MNMQVHRTGVGNPAEVTGFPPELDGWRVATVGSVATPAQPLTVLEPAVDERTDERTETEPPKAAHIVKTEPGESAVAKVTEARIYGYPVEALCGERFVPQQDPKRLPLCDTCKEIYELYRQLGDGGLSETPAS